MQKASSAHELRRSVGGDLSDGLPGFDFFSLNTLAGSEQLSSFGRRVAWSICTVSKIGNFSDMFGVALDGGPIPPPECITEKSVRWSLSFASRFVCSSYFLVPLVFAPSVLDWNMKTCLLHLLATATSLKEAAFKYVQVPRLAHFGALLSQISLLLLQSFASSVDRIRVKFLHLKECSSPHCLCEPSLWLDGIDLVRLRLLYSLNSTS